MAPKNSEPSLPSAASEPASRQPVVQGVYPFLFLDRVLEKKSDSLLIQKTVTCNEWSTPAAQALPLWVLIEIMAQAAGALNRTLFPERSNAGGYHILNRIKHAQYLQPVFPGDALTVQARLLKRIKNHSAFSLTVQTAGSLNAEAEIYLTCF